ncbi:DUF6230 family protein [Natronosalvus caseinilyticus]|uniref:DUF6230 family protein n=1 Tax=Natronosalvus caseinilyticus TaxID=2953747 RepID=UPI0028A921B3|nr:DUF6230 family protein [Natronosalvus caseinilyticus]
MYNKKRLLTGTGASFFVVALVGLIVLSSGTAYAAPLAGAGGFTVEADEIRSEEFLLYPGVGESDEGTTPVVVVEQRGVEIDGLVLTREQPLDALPGVDGSMMIEFTTDDTVTANEQYLKMTGQSAESATFNGQVINAQQSDDPNQQFQQTAGDNSDPEEGLLTNVEGEGPGMVQEDAEIDMVYLASDEITLPGLDVNVYYEG